MIEDRKNEGGYIIYNGWFRQYATLREAKREAERYISRGDAPDGCHIAKIVEIIRVKEGTKMNQENIINKDAVSKGGYIVARKNEFLVYNTLEEAEKAAEQALEYRHEGAFSIAEVCETVWIEITSKIFKEVVK